VTVVATFALFVSTIVVVATRQIKVGMVDGMPELEDASGHVIRTGTINTQTDLAALPQSADFKQYDSYSKVEVTDLRTLLEEINIVNGTVTYPDAWPVRSFTVTSWHWESTTRMSVIGDDGSAVLIDNAAVQALSPPDGALYFVDGTASLAGTYQSQNATLLTQAFAEHCAASHCPLTACVGSADGLHLSEVSCHGKSIWRFPSGVHLTPPPAEHGRQLSACTDSFKKCCGSKMDSCKSCTSAVCGPCYGTPCMKKIFGKK